MAVFRIDNELLNALPHHRSVSEPMPRLVTPPVHRKSPFGLNSGYAAPDFGDTVFYTDVGRKVMELLLAAVDEHGRSLIKDSLGLVRSSPMGLSHVREWSSLLVSAYVTIRIPSAYHSHTVCVPSVCHPHTLQETKLGKRCKLGPHEIVWIALGFRMSCGW